MHMIMSGHRYLVDVSHKHIATPRLANRTLLMVTFHEPTLKLHVITLASPMSDYYMKWLNDLANCLNMFRISSWTTLVFRARASLVIKPCFVVFHLLNMTCLTNLELGVRDLAWRRSLKQSCSIWYKEQLLFLGHWLIQLLTCLNLDHKNQQINISILNKIF